MDKLHAGVRKFQQSVFPEMKSLFSSLKAGQSPHTLFITCSDSRIDPHLITQCQPGELFVVRNAGNLVDPYNDKPNAATAAIEYGVGALGIENIVVCGHSHCGAMNAIACKQDLTALPAVASWLQAADKTMADDPELENNLKECVEYNVVEQLNNLKTHPVVLEALNQNKMNIAGWVYSFEEGKVEQFSAEQGCFVTL